MTEKRFELAYEKGNWWAVRDGEITLWKEEVIGLLNEQDIEIKRLKEELFEARKDYIVDTADISDKPYLDEMIEEERKEIYERDLW